MESRIPSGIPGLSSVRKPAPPPSRLQIPSTVGKRPQGSLIRPTMPSTGIKRPLETSSSALLNKRAAPMSLLKPPSSSSLAPLPRFNNPMAPREMAAALDSVSGDEHDAIFQTPVAQKENKCFNAAYQDMVRSSPIPVPTYTPVKKVVKEDKECNTDIEWASFDKEAEISHYKTQIAALKNELSDMEFNEKELKLTADTLKIQYDRLHSDFEAFKAQSNTELEGSAQALRDKEEAFNQEKAKLQDEMFELQQKSLEESRLKSETQSLLHTLETELSQLKTELEKAILEGELKDSQLDTANNKVEHYKSRESEFLSAQQEVIQLQEEIKRLHEKEKLAELFSDELKDLKVVEDENRVLKLKLESLQESLEKTKLLEEQVAQKEEENGYLQSQIADAQAKIEALGYTQVQLTDWQTKLGSDSPDEFASQLEILKQNNLLLTGENDCQKSSIASLEEQIQLHTAQYKEVDEELREAQKKVHEQDEALHEAQDKVALLEKHNEMLNERAEETSTQKMQLAEQLNSQIEQLNNDAKGYKVILSEKEAELFTIKADKQSVEALLEQRNSMINDLNQQIYALQAKMAEDETARAEQLAEAAIEDSRVVTMTVNPHQAAQEEREKRFQELVKENERLNGLVEVLQSEENKADMTMQINNVLEKNSIIAKLEVEKAKCRKVLDKERENNHLIIRKLRSHITDLTGFKVYMDKLFQTVTLRHTLHEGFKAVFHFTDEGIELVTKPKEDLCPKVEEYIGEYLEKGGYPVFLAAITMDLFKQRL